MQTTPATTKTIDKKIDVMLSNRVVLKEYNCEKSDNSDILLFYVTEKTTKLSHTLIDANVGINILLVK
ncbi:hypothetical protein [Abyssisolibacter fermentans]|uniref:hypothetical protein n=1 Tax=Abyssisolibacter fermentans TaxID=1766203 RepID=UPI00082E6FF0|nr:hypothetical protein [Abyssisolibacter fermentans]